MDWFLYDNGPRHEKVSCYMLHKRIQNPVRHLRCRAFYENS